MSDDNPFGGEGLQGLIQKAAEMQAQVQQAQQRAASRTVTGEAGGGLVRVTVNGRMEVVAVAIEPGVVDPADVEMLQDLVTAASNAALKKARDLVSEELGPLARMLEMSGLGGGGGFGLE